MNRFSELTLDKFRAHTGLPQLAIYALLEAGVLPLSLSAEGKIIVDTSKLSVPAIESALESAIHSPDLSESSVLAEKVRLVLDREFENILQSAQEIASKGGTVE